jgi:hypothetical protein
MPADRPMPPNLLAQVTYQPPRAWTRRTMPPLAPCRHCGAILARHAEAGPRYCPSGPTPRPPAPELRP